MKSYIYLDADHLHRFMNEMVALRGPHLTLEFLIILTFLCRVWELLRPVIELEFTLEKTYPRHR